MKKRISVVEYLQVDQIYIGCQQQKTIAENNDSRMSQKLFQFYLQYC